MIRKLQTRFIIIAISVITIVTCSIFGIITFENYNMMNRQLDGLLNLISENDGRIPEYKPRDDELADFITKETQFSTRYFIIRTNDDGEILETNMQYIAAVNQEDAQTILQEVLADSKQTGYYGNYKYRITQDEEEKLIIFLDCSMQLNNFQSTTEKSVLIIAIGLLIVFLCISVLSKRVLAPMIKNIEKQKQFVTNAGHELKTPLAVIMANTDILEMTSKENNELIISIKKQAQRLDTLIKSLLNLANVEERRMEMNHTEFCVTDLIQEEIKEFGALAQDKQIIYDVKQDIKMKVKRDSIKELITILLDNAIKYTPNEGKIEIKVEKQGKSVKMQFMNTCENSKNIHTTKIFDRFYREDQSRSKTKEGYGVGLSIAKSIVDIHKGKITAEITKEDMICFTVII